MKPITVSIRVHRSREDVFAFLDVLANHVSFTDHMLVDWSFDGPRAGAGAKARMRANMPGQNWMELKVLSVIPPATTIEETVGANGKRRTRGTYTLEELPDGGTNIRFELAYLAAPRSERLAAPLTRAYMKRANAKALQRLASLLEHANAPSTDNSRTARSPGS